VATQLLHLYFPPRENNLSTTSVEYFGPFVKHLIIGGPYLEHDSLITFLEACHNVGDLALWTHIPTRELLPVLKMLSLTRLSINLSGLKFEELTSSAFTNITHLDITVFDRGPHIGWPQWRPFTHFTSLTHLAINEVMDNSDEIVHNLLRDCQRLQILLIVEVVNPWDLKNVPFSDPRLILMKIQRYCCEDWVEGAKGNEDIWRCAEEISRAKQRNLSLYLTTSLPSRSILDGFFKNIDYPDMWFTQYDYREELYQRCGYPT
jgi:hypothetical protein